jgi:hypothetical protein
MPDALDFFYQEDSISMYIHRIYLSLLVLCVYLFDEQIQLLSLVQVRKKMEWASSSFSFFFIHA